MEKIKYADATWVDNDEAHHSAAPKYLHVNINGNEDTQYLFTAAELKKAAKRADKNTEDQAYIGFVRRALTKFLYAFK